MLLVLSEYLILWCSLPPTMAHMFDSRKFQGMLIAQEYEQNVSRGPTLCFRIHSYSLMRDIASIQVVC
jgi:hypothetical protein